MTFLVLTFGKFCQLLLSRHLKFVRILKPTKYQENFNWKTKNQVGFGFLSDNQNFGFRLTSLIVVHTHVRSGEGWADWGDSHGGYGVGLTVEYPWHRAPRNTLRPQRGQRSGSARLSSGPADRCVPFCPFFEATRGKRAANHQVCSGLPLPTAVVPLPQYECAGRAAPAGTHIRQVSIKFRITARQPIAGRLDASSPPANRRPAAQDSGAWRHTTAERIVVCLVATRGTDTVRSFGYRKFCDFYIVITACEVYSLKRNRVL